MSVVRVQEIMEPETLVSLYPFTDTFSSEELRDLLVSLPKDKGMIQPFFPSGIVGDGEKYLSAEMAAKLDQITAERFQGSGISI